MGAARYDICKAYYSSGAQLIPPKVRRGRPPKNAKAFENLPDDSSTQAVGRKVTSKSETATATKRLPRKKPSAPRTEAVEPVLTASSIDATLPAAPIRRRRNRRSEETIASILDATGKVLLDAGTAKLSILDVCNAAGISRGTFYRYFASQEDLLEAFARDSRDRRYQGVVAATAPHDDPDKRFQAFLDYFAGSIQAGQLQRLLLVAPEYAIAYITRIFHDSVIRFQDVLKPVFDAWEERLGTRLDRELLCEVFVRLAISEHLVPVGKEQQPLARRIEKLISVLLSGSLARRPR